MKKEAHKWDCAWQKTRARCDCGKVPHKATRPQKMTKAEFEDCVYKQL